MWVSLKFKFNYVFDSAKSMGYNLISLGIFRFLGKKKIINNEKN